MAIAGKSIINTNVDEKGFVEAIYDYITIDLKYYCPSISCDTTVDAQFDDAEITTPTFNFTITPNIVLQMIRPAAKTTAVQAYQFNVVINDEVKATATPAFASEAKDLNANVERKIFIGYASEVLNTFIWIGPYNINPASISNASIAICSIADSNNYRYGAGCVGADIEDAVFFKSGESAIEYSIANLFNYETEAGYIEYITHVSFINAGQEQFRTETLVNCSTVSQGRSLAIQPGNYFSVGQHILIALD